MFSSGNFLSSENWSLCCTSWRYCEWGPSERWGSYKGPGTAINTVHAFSCLIITKPLQRPYCCYWHLTGERLRRKVVGVTCPIPSSSDEAEMGLEPGSVEHAGPCCLPLDPVAVLYSVPFWMPLEAHVFLGLLYLPVFSLTFYLSILLTVFPDTPIIKYYDSNTWKYYFRGDTKVDDENSSQHM